jgi:hypothetical protein
MTLDADITSFDQDDFVKKLADKLTADLNNENVISPSDITIRVMGGSIAVEIEIVVPDETAADVVVSTLGDTSTLTTALDVTVESVERIVVTPEVYAAPSPPPPAPPPPLSPNEFCNEYDEKERIVVSITGNVPEGGVIKPGGIYTENNLFFCCKQCSETDDCTAFVFTRATNPTNDECQQYKTLLEYTLSGDENNLGYLPPKSPPPSPPPSPAPPLASTLELFLELEVLIPIIVGSILLVAAFGFFIFRYCNTERSAGLLSFLSPVLKYFGINADTSSTKGAKTTPAAPQLKMNGIVSTAMSTGKTALQNLPVSNALKTSVNDFANKATGSLPSVPGLPSTTRLPSAQNTTPGTSLQSRRLPTQIGPSNTRPVQPSILQSSVPVAPVPPPSRPSTFTTLSSANAISTVRLGSDQEKPKPPQLIIK